MIVQISSGKYVGRTGVLRYNADGSEYVEIYEDAKNEWIDVPIMKDVTVGYVFTDNK